MVGEDHHAVGAADSSGEATHGLAHHTGLDAHGGVAHLTFELLLGDEGGDGVDDDDIDGTGADEGFGDIEGVFARFGLGDQEVV